MLYTALHLALVQLTPVLMEGILRPTLRILPEVVCSELTRLS